jgi:hypothetical protein
LASFNCSFEDDQLNISEGKIIIDPRRVRDGTLFNLLINKKKMRFRCVIADGMKDDCFFNEEDLKKYQDKIGKTTLINSSTTSSSPPPNSSNPSAATP